MGDIVPIKPQDLVRSQEQEQELQRLRREVEHFLNSRPMLTNGRPVPASPPFNSERILERLAELEPDLKRRAKGEIRQQALIEIERIVNSF